MQLQRLPYLGRGLGGKEPLPTFWVADRFYCLCSSRNRPVFRVHKCREQPASPIGFCVEYSGAAMDGADNAAPVSASPQETNSTGAAGAQRLLELALSTKARRSNTKLSSSIALRDPPSSQEGIPGWTLTSLGPSAPQTSTQGPVTASGRPISF
jgi:hypothetical protein